MAYTNQHMTTGQIRYTGVTFKMSHVLSYYNKGVINALYGHNHLDTVIKVTI